MVYILGAKPVGLYTPSKQVLDGDVWKVDVADKTPGPGFDAGSAKAFASIQGRPVETEFMPTRILWKGRSRVPDFDRSYDMLIVPKRFREIVESLEPGVHQFLPVTYVNKKGDTLGERFFFIACHRIDSVDRAHTTKFLAKGAMWIDRKSAAEIVPHEIPPGLDLNVERRLVFNKSQIGNIHAWCDMFLIYGPFVSDTLAEACMAEKFSGIVLNKQEAV